ncbi:glycerol-3-phosphate responsive antiterminator [Paenibacillus sp. TRM 82003]|nr:glycerol-3-phosphate responsive antiterminator [Paenibacillus sp. TRM 82003]
MAEKMGERLPVIASITKLEQVDAALRSQVKRVNLMTGDIIKLPGIVGDLQQAGKKVYVHLEMVGGIGRDNSAVQYLADAFGIDGIVTTKSNAVAAARQAGIQSIQRVFAIDSAAVETAIKMIGQAQPNEVELMPGLMPRVIRYLKTKAGRPLIVGGLIRSEEEMREALASGADHVSIGDAKFW